MGTFWSYSHTFFYTLYTFSLWFSGLKDDDRKAGGRDVSSASIIVNVSKQAPAVEGKNALYVTNAAAPHLAHWPCSSCVILCVGQAESGSPGSQSLEKVWFKGLLSERDAKTLEHSGKMVLLFKILKMAEELEDKVYVCVHLNTELGSLKMPIGPHI